MMLILCFYSGHLCAALPKAIMTMKKGEKVKLVVQPQCMSFTTVTNCFMRGFDTVHLDIESKLHAFLIVYLIGSLLLNFNFRPSSGKMMLADAFGQEGKDASDAIHPVPPNSTLHIDLELISFKPVIDVTGDAKVFKKIMKEGEGSLVANEGATVTSKYSDIGKIKLGWSFLQSDISLGSKMKLVRQI